MACSLLLSAVIAATEPSPSRFVIAGYAPDYRLESLDLLALADNTSALSWLRYASRTRRPHVRRLARFFLSMLAHPFPALTLRVQGKHLPGLENVGADFLSRFEKAPS